MNKIKSMDFVKLYDDWLSRKKLGDVFYNAVSHYMDKEEKVELCGKSDIKVFNRVFLRLQREEIGDWEIKLDFGKDD